MADLLQLARRSPAKFPKATPTVCIFCGRAGRTWCGTGPHIEGCDCSWAKRARGYCKPAEKLEFQMLERLETGRLVITKCSPELWAPLIETGLAVAQSGFGASMGKELSEDSRQAMRDAVTAHRERNANQSSVTPSGVRTGENEPAVTPTTADSATPAVGSVACVECGKLFTPARSTARYCSGACRVRAARKR